MNNINPSPAIVSSERPVTIVGAADVSARDLSVALSLAPTVVAADGGANQLVAHNVMPEAVIGDLDSLSDAARRRHSGRLHRIEEQESVDFDKALRHVAAPLVVALGVTGGRLDHQLAALNVLVRHPHRACIILGGGSAICACPPRLVLGLAPGTPVSLFPMTAVSVASQGLSWPTDGFTMTPAGRIGTSNAATGPVTLSPDGSGLLVILPDTELAGLVKSFLAPDATRWPAPSG